MPGGGGGVGTVGREYEIEYDIGRIKNVESNICYLLVLGRPGSGPRKAFFAFELLYRLKGVLCGPWDCHKQREQAWFTPVGT